MTLFALRTRDDLLAVRFAISPVWETQAAVQAVRVELRAMARRDTQRAGRPSTEQPPEPRACIACRAPALPPPKITLRILLP